MNSAGSGLTRQQLHNCAQLANRPGWHGRYHKGHLKCTRALKRHQAKHRNGAPR